MTKISAVIITKNEAGNIEACLEPLFEVADEVLVVDSGSEDDTVAISRRMGARVIETAWQGFSETKNLANRQAENDWILSIDADEVVSSELLATLKKLTPEKDTIYALDRITRYGDRWIKHSGWYPEWKNRLFHREQARWEGDFVHEELSFDATLRVKKLTGKLYHYSYKGDADHLERIRRYAELSADELFTQGKRAGFIKLYLSPVFRFLRSYFVKAGFLDGKAGLTIAKMDYHLVKMKYRALVEKYKK